jgi:hypothetical protein
MLMMALMAFAAGAMMNFEGVKMADKKRQNDFEWVYIKMRNS